VIQRVRIDLRNSWTTGKLEVVGLSVGVSRKFACSRNLGASRFGDVKGTIRSDMRLRFVSNDFRRHRVISISYISLLPCHGTVRWSSGEQEDTAGNRAISEGNNKVSHAGG
jgi:hypothetical protein